MIKLSSYGTHRPHQGYGPVAALGHWQLKVITCVTLQSVVHQDGRRKARAPGIETGHVSCSCHIVPVAFVSC
jgi:hypothetical protein